jgi:hypothetical protein
MNETSVQCFTCAYVIFLGKDLVSLNSGQWSPKLTHMNQLWHFVQDIGIMEQLVTDGDPTMAYKAWKDMIREFRMKQTTTEPYSPWQNCSELEVRAIKCGIRRFTKKTRSPKRLWCFLGIHICPL